MTFELTDEVEAAVEAVVNADKVFVTSAMFRGIPVFVVMVEAEGDDGEPIMSPVSIVVDSTVFEEIAPDDMEPVAFDVAESG